MHGECTVAIHIDGVACCHSCDDKVTPSITVQQWSHQQPHISEQILLAVTSLSPRNHQRQPICMNSWKQAGLMIASVNTSQEIKELKDRYPQVDYWIENDNVDSPFVSNTQPINALLDVSLNLDTTILLLNSDIEIYGDQSVLIDAANTADEKLTGAIRHNWRKSHDFSTRERFGIDGFFISPSTAKSISKQPYSIGKPLWDYWLPMACKEMEIDLIGRPFFYHKMHAPNWIRSEWDLAAQWWCEEFNVDVLSSFNFRSSLPYPPEPGLEGSTWHMKKQSTS